MKELTEEEKGIVEMYKTGLATLEEASVLLILKGWVGADALKILRQSKLKGGDNEVH